MFDRLSSKLIMISLISSILGISSEYGKTLLTPEINQHRLKQSTLSMAPKYLNQDRHQFVLSKSKRFVSKTKKQPTIVNNGLIEQGNVSVNNQHPEHLNVSQSIVKFNWTMMPPVKTGISKKFGQGDKNLSRGIIYTLSASQTVHAPLDGKIIFAGLMKDYGYVVMIKKDFSNIILVAGISNVDIKQDDTVCRGQKIGAVVKGGWVYLEFRHQGNPIDPQQVLASGNINEE